jgi:hypothetical protein
LPDNEKVCILCSVFNKISFMRKLNTQRGTKLTIVCGAIAVMGMFVLINSCSKSSKHTTPESTTDNSAAKKAATVTQNLSQTHLVTVANIRKSGDGNTNEAMFNELAELFTVSDATVLSALQNALSSNTPVNVTVDPWKATVLQVSAASQQDAASVRSAKQSTNTQGAAYQVDLANTSADVINNLAGAAILNTTSTNLTSVIPDMATAQLMFDYITHQCCALPGPYAIDYCIPFQYCEDGCYARAHKMC